MVTIFKVGDTVQLKSGSQSMTVAELKTTFDGDAFTGYVVCKWYLDGKFHSESFHQDTLEKD